MFLMNSKLFQDIFDLLVDVLPENWKKLVFMAEYTEGSYSMKYYVQIGESDYLDCFKLGNIDDLQLLQLFIKLNNIISPERSSLQESEKWNVLSMTVDSDGKMKTDFDYTDISNDVITYEDEWMKKYLV